MVDAGAVPVAADAVAPVGTPREAPWSLVAGGLQGGLGQRRPTRAAAESARARGGGGRNRWRPGRGAGGSSVWHQGGVKGVARPGDGRKGRWRLWNHAERGQMKYYERRVMGATVMGVASWGMQRHCGQSFQAAALAHLAHPGRLFDAAMAVSDLNIGQRTIDCPVDPSNSANAACYQSTRARPRRNGS